MGAMCVSSASPVTFDLSTNFGLFLFADAWAYQLKIFFARRTRVCERIMPGQGKFYHGVSLMQCETYIMSRSGIGEPILE